MTVIAERTDTSAPIRIEERAPGVSEVVDDPASWVHFDFHGLMRVRVARGSPTLAQLEEMFAPFRTDEPGRARITVVDEPLAADLESHAEDELRFTDQSLHLLESDVQMSFDDDEIRLYGTRELLTFLLPLIDREMVRAGAAMIHAATMSYRGTAIVMAAWGGVGKTSTIAKLIGDPDVEFFGDDWAWVTESELLGYAKPMYIKPHHRDIYPHLFKGVRKPLVPSKLSRTIGRATTLVHPFVTRYPRVAKIARRWSPEYIMRSPAEALPEARVGDVAPLGLFVFVERYSGEAMSLVERDDDWMVTRLLGNFYIEMSRSSKDVFEALAATGHLPIADAFNDKRKILELAVAGKPIYHLRVPAAASADAASNMIVEQLYELLTEAD